MESTSERKICCIEAELHQSAQPVRAEARPFTEVLIPLIPLQGSMVHQDREGHGHTREKRNNTERHEALITANCHFGHLLNKMGGAVILWPSKDPQIEDTAAPDS